MNNLLRTAVLAGGVLLTSWGNPVTTEGYVPDVYDSEFIERVLSIYDTHVGTIVREELPIDEAYLKFMEEVNKDWDGNLHILNPDLETLFDFFYDIITGNIWSNIIRPVYGHYPVKGWYVFPSSGLFEIIREVAKENPFWEKMDDSIKAGGDVGPAIFSTVLINYDKINFSKDLERFLVAYMMMPDLPAIEKFTLQMDVESNREIIEGLDEKNKAYFEKYYNYDYKRTD